MMTRQNYALDLSAEERAVRPAPKHRTRTVKRERVSSRYFVFMAGLMAVALLFAFQYAQVVQRGCEVNELQSKVADLQAEQERLQLELAMDTRPELIDQRAKNELGMVQPTADQLRILPIHSAAALSFFDPPTAEPDLGQVTKALSKAEGTDDWWTRAIMEWRHLVGESG